MKEIKSTTYANNNHIQVMRIIFALFVFVAIPILFCLSKKKSVMRRITGALLCLFFLYFSFGAFVVFHHPKVPEMTPEKAQKFFETVGGVNEVNREAGILLNRPQPDGWPFLFPDYAHTTTNAPAIASLYSILKNYSVKDYGGTSVSISTDNGKHIQIAFGNHWVFKRIYIFDPNAPVTFNSPSNWFQVSSNIFVSR